jgi:hypothetical protein
MKDDCREYLKKGMQEKFITYRHNNSPDFFSAGVVLTVHPVMMDLEEGKSPEEAWENATQQTLHHSGANTAAVNN